MPEWADVDSPVTEGERGVARLTRPGLSTAQRALSRWRRKSSPSDFPWLTPVVGAAVLLASAPPSGWREGAANFMAYWFMLIFLGFLGGLLLAPLFAYLVTHEEPEEIVNGARLVQFVMFLGVILLWGWRPTWLPPDLGEGYP